jgi:1,4-alpha-glucan branching enzyme
MKSSRSSTKVKAAPGQRVVRFELPFLEAREAFVAGTFNGWDPAMFRMSEVPGGWAAEVALAPGTHEYLFVVDGRWIADPNNPKTSPNPFGGVNSVIEALPSLARARRATSKSNPTAP